MGPPHTRGRAGRRRRRSPVGRASAGELYGRSLVGREGTRSGGSPAGRESSGDEELTVLLSSDDWGPLPAGTARRRQPPAQVGGRSPRHGRAATAVELTVGQGAGRRKKRSKRAAASMDAILNRKQYAARRPIGGRHFARREYEPSPEPAPVPEPISMPRAPPAVEQAGDTSLAVTRGAREDRLRKLEALAAARRRRRPPPSPSASESPQDSSPAPDHVSESEFEEASPPRQRHVSLLRSWLSMPRSLAPGGTPECVQHSPPLWPQASPAAAAAPPPGGCPGQGEVEEKYIVQGACSSPSAVPPGGLGGGRALAATPLLGPEGDCCMVCLDPLAKEEVGVLECGHEFHFQCIQAWFASSIAALLPPPAAAAARPAPPPRAPCPLCKEPFAATEGRVRRRPPAPGACSGSGSPGGTRHYDEAGAAAPPARQLPARSVAGQEQENASQGAPSAATSAPVPAGIDPSFAISMLTAGGSKWSEQERRRREPGLELKLHRGGGRE